MVSAGVAAASKNADAARALIRFLASSDAAGTVKASGLEPMASMDAQQSAPAPSSAATTAIDKVLADAVARGDVPGVVAMVTDRRGIVYQGAFGVADAASGRPMTVDTVFRIASMTKPVTSLAVMQLVEQGRLSLDDPAEKYLPQLANLKVFETFDSRTGAYTVRPARRAPTLRHMLTHTAGLGYGFTSAIVRDFKPRAGETYAAGPLLFDPGEQWLYSTRHRLGRPHRRDVDGQESRVVLPRSHLRSARDGRYVLQSAGRTTAAPGCLRTGAARMALSRSIRFSRRWLVAQPIGGGGLASTASDYIRFLQMLLNQGSLNGARIVSRDTVATMSRNQIGSVGVPAVKTAMPERSSDFMFVDDGRDKWGIGFMITTVGKPGRRSAGSLSWGGISNTYFWIDPARGIAGVILMQFLPFADSKALAVYDSFERAVYKLK